MDNLTPEQILDALENKMSELKGLISAKADGNAIDALKAEIDGLKEKHFNAQIEELKATMKTQGETITELKNKGMTPQEKKDFKSLVRKALEEKKDKIKNFKKNSAFLEVEIKAADTITFGNIIRS